eukprot:EG_transcript_20657
MAAVLSSLPRSGADGTRQLTKVRPGAFPRIAALRGRQDPPFDGSFQDLRQQRGQGHGAHGADLEVQLRNKVRRCKCGKPNAYTLTTCNSCGAALPEETTFTDNVFMGFIYGIRGFPISLRAESADFLCFDDLLQLSCCHLNCIPTTVYIPDWRSLLKRPRDGLRLMDQIFDTCWKVFAETFYADPAWRHVWLKGPPSLEAMREYVVAGLNYPPSQYQLHLQFMVLPLQPFQYKMYLKGVHYTYGRFFPLEYVREVLQADRPIPNADELDIEDIIRRFDDLGIRYDDIHARCYARYGQRHEEIANYTPDQFEAVIVD